MFIICELTMHSSDMASSDDLTNCLMLEDTRYKIKEDI